MVCGAVPRSIRVLSRSHGCRCRGAAAANAVVIEQHEAPNGNATSLPARSPLGPSANDYCCSLVPMPLRRRVWRLQAKTDAACAARRFCSKLEHISGRRRRQGGRDGGEHRVRVVASCPWPVPCPQTTIQRGRCHSPGGAGWRCVVPSVPIILQQSPLALCLIN